MVLGTPSKSHLESTEAGLRVESHHFENELLHSEPILLDRALNAFNISLSIKSEMYKKLH